MASQNTGITVSDNLAISLYTNFLLKANLLKNWIGTGFTSSGAMNAVLNPQTSRAITK